MTSRSAVTSAVRPRLSGQIVFLIGEHLRAQLKSLLAAYLGDSRVERVVLITATPAAAAQIAASFGAQREEGRLVTVLASESLEEALAAARRGWGEPDVVIQTPLGATLSALTLPGTVSYAAD